MKTLSIILCLLFSGVALSQENATAQKENKITLSAATERGMAKDFSADQIADMKENYPAKLASLEYYYSHSYQVKKGQSVSDEQIRKINVSQLDKLRAQDKAVEIKDKASNLVLILDSFQTMKERMNALMKEK